MTDGSDGSDPKTRRSISSSDVTGADSDFGDSDVES